ncbi:MAG: hypothetical protein HY664_08730 [Chloroflexi bacterium]|nr:hypothetical protein [Chloroflexota bacterium]
MNVEVHSYSGHTYAQRPGSFLWEGVEHKVKEVVREWREPGKKHFLVTTEEKRSFELVFDEGKDEWRLMEELSK